MPRTGYVPKPGSGRYLGMSKIPPFHQQTRTRQDQAGFSLLELLVIILIVSILAAIAIPMLLGQRDKGYEAQLRSALRGAASAAHAAGIAAGGDYAALDQNPALLFEQGLRVAEGVQVGIAASGDSFCVAASHHRLSSDHEWKAAGFDSTVGAPAAGATVCPAAALLAATTGPGPDGGSVLAGADGSSSSEPEETAEVNPDSSGETPSDPSDETDGGSSDGTSTGATDSPGTGSTDPESTDTGGTSSKRKKVK